MLYALRFKMKAREQFEGNILILSSQQAFCPDGVLCMDVNNDVIISLSATMNKQQ
jgi:hypothetical protein